jgi:hypothetical protein
MIREPTVRWRPVDFPYTEGKEITGNHELESLANELWARLGKFLERSEFDYWPPTYYPLEDEDLAAEVAVQTSCS